MKRSSVILAALLSGFALASPDDGACGQATVTVTQVITTTLGSDNASAPSQAVVAVGSQAGSAPSVAAGGAIDAAAPTSIAIPSTVADPSVAAPPVVNDSAASAIIDAPSAPTDSSSPSADGPGGDATDDPDGTQGDSAPVTVTEVVTSIINGGARTITVTNVATHYSAPTPAVPVVTTVTKVYTSIVNGGAGTITVTKTEEHTISGHHLHGTGTKTGSAGSPTHHVTVGKDGKMAYEPSFVKAAVGDTVRFRFFPTNHTVTSSDFDTPCKKNGVFDSGFKPTFISNSTTFVDYSVKDASKPLWFHSRQKDECKQGMVFAINPKDQDQFNQFAAKVRNPSSNQTDSKPSNSTTIKPSTPVVLSTNTTAVNETRKATPIRLRL